VVAELQPKTLTPLSDPAQDVTGFDLVDRTHFVYAARDPLVWTSAVDRRSAEAVLTGKTLTELIFPVDLYPSSSRYYERSQLWAAQGGSVHLVKRESGEPWALFAEGLRTLQLSPDGQTLLTVEAMAHVPEFWPHAYPSSMPGSAYGVRAGDQNLGALSGSRYVSRYVLVDLTTGRAVTPLDAPTGLSAAWSSSDSPQWSRGGDAVLLPNAFVPVESESAVAAAPCNVLFERREARARCVKKPDARFSAASTRRKRVELKVTQSASESPKLVAIDGKTTRLVWDPNPQLADIQLGPVVERHWKDETGREWIGGVYLPPDLKPGTRYPLVIQTHHFVPSVFRPSGLYPTGYAARVLAASGIVVLEARCKAKTGTMEEGSCQAPGFESAVEMLAAEGLIDATRIGIIGFSRTCYNTLEVLTRSKLHIVAATITDGVNEGYWQYLFTADTPVFGDEASILNGGEPFGAGLQQWLQNSPNFNLDRTDAAIQVVGEGMSSLMFMWEPYALMRYQGKAVDLVLLNTDEHVLTTPAIRVASQGGAVDWMRFWLQGHEDSAEGKAAQYQRWRKMRAAKERK
jgi:dipeptidyl aminopeptidase/acylaminoacyl peptidase